MSYTQGGAPFTHSALLIFARAAQRCFVSPNALHFCTRLSAWREGCGNADDRSDDEDAAKKKTFNPNDEEVSAEARRVPHFPSPHRAIYIQECVSLLSSGRETRAESEHRNAALRQATGETGGNAKDGMNERQERRKKNMRKNSHRLITTHTHTQRSSFSHWESQTSKISPKHTNAESKAITDPQSHAGTADADVNNH